MTNPKYQLIESISTDTIDLTKYSGILDRLALKQLALKVQEAGFPDKLIILTNIADKLRHLTFTLDEKAINDNPAFHTLEFTYSLVNDAVAVELHKEYLKYIDDDGDDDRLEANYRVTDLVITVELQSDIVRVFATAG